MSHEPSLASQEIEELMEGKELPESDRDEVRRAAELFGFIRKKRECDRSPMPDHMKNLILGKD